MEVVLRGAAGEQDLARGAAQRFLHQLGGDVDAVAVVVDAAAGGAEDLAAGAGEDLDAGALEHLLGRIDDAHEVSVLQGPVAAAGEAGRRDRGLGARGGALVAPSPDACHGICLLLPAGLAPPSWRGRPRPTVQHTTKSVALGWTPRPPPDCHAGKASVRERGPGPTMRREASREKGGKEG